jgi:hypothetical protein
MTVSILYLSLVGIKTEMPAHSLYVDICYHMNVYEHIKLLETDYVENKWLLSQCKACIPCHHPIQYVSNGADFDHPSLY